MNKICSSFHVSLLAFCFALLPPIAQAQIQTDVGVLQFPAIGSWNGYLNNQNYLECVNAGSSEVILRLIMLSNAGVELGRRDFSIAARASEHVDLNAYGIQNAYGSYRLEKLSGPADTVSCGSAIYRTAPASAGRAVDYAFYLPVTNPQYGTRYGSFNTLDPENRGGKTYNWLSVTNLDSAARTFLVELFDQTGTALTQYSLTSVAAGERRDVALGHDLEINGGLLTGLYRVSSTEGSPPFKASVTRFGQLGGEYRFAFPLSSESGSCGGDLVPVSTMDPATNWAEVINTDSVTRNVTLHVRDNAGLINSSVSLSLAAHSQQHVHINPILGARNVGQMFLDCGDSSVPMLLQSLFYGHPADDLSQVRYAYGSQMQRIYTTQSLALVAPLNTNLGMLNWIKLANGAGQTAAPSLTISAVNGTLRGQSSVSVAAQRAVDIYANDTIGDADIGSLLVGSGQERVAGELLRVFPHSSEGIGSVMRVPSMPVLSSTPTVSLQTVISGGFTLPIALVDAPDGNGRLFVVQQRGLIRILNSGSILSTPFLDLSAIVSQAGSERGLLGLAFHPQYTSNRKFYVYYTVTNGDIKIAEYQASIADANQADPSTARVLLTIPHQNYGNHNGGQLAFGPDGYLYGGTGDGGGGGDPLASGQNLGTLLAKIWRIDVDSGSPYGIPADNPFIGVSGALPEIYAYGLRNPWRFSFDSVTGRLFVADVGQNAYEEIDLVERGGNYGWKIREAAHCYSPSTGCQTSGLIDPITEYSHSLGLAVIGGFVYRGSEEPSLYGSYFFSDYATGRLWMLNESSRGGWLRTELLQTGYLISSMGVGEDGSIYLVGLTGRVDKIVVN